MQVKVVIINLDSVLMKADVKSFEEKLRSILGIDGDLKSLIAEASTRALDEEKVKAIDEALREVELKTAEEAEIDQRDLEAICTLKAIGVKLALVTMRCRSSTEKAIEKMGLKGLFDVVITRDEEPEKAHQISRACSSLGLRVDEALYVGFSRADAIAGVQAGCLVATPHRVLQALGQTIRVNSLSELLDTFKFMS